MPTMLRIFQGVSIGRPAMLSSLKSLLETGTAFAPDIGRERLECLGGENR
jgi:hypothetical protein